MIVPKVAFLGTPQSAVPAFRQLREIAEVTAVITRPDRARGRSRRPLPTPVKVEAVEAGIPVYEAESGGDLRASWFDAIEVAVVVAFGVLIPTALLELPAYGFVNVHFSLLPRWRGASPVTAAIAAGDSETGVTLIRLDSGLDTGPILSAQLVSIDPAENSAQLTARLANVGATLLAAILPAYLMGAITPVAQNGSEATYAPRLTKAASRLDLGADPVVVARMVRALAPRPGLRLSLDSGEIKILAARPVMKAVGPGTLLLEEGRLLLGVDAGAIELEQVQPAGRSPMSGADWARGWRVIPTVRR